MPRIIQLKHTNNEVLENIKNIFSSITVNCLINNYVLENVALGLIKPNEKIPFDTYISDLELQELNPYLHRNMIKGIFIDRDEKVVNKEKEEFLLEYYSGCINIIFEKIMKSKYSDENDYGMPCQKVLRDYFLEAYKLFKEILKTEIEYEFFDTIPNVFDKNAHKIFLAKVTKFIVSLKLNGIRAGKCVDRYLKGIEFLPFAIQNLVKNEKNRYILKRNTETIEYKIALFYIFPYLNEEHRKIFELKAKRWYELYLQNQMKNY